MADHSKPVLTDNYTDVLSQIRGRLDDQAKQFDPVVTSPTNIPTGTIRWDSASFKDQKWNGTAWVDKSSNYSFNQITLTGGTANAIPYLNGSKVLTSGTALTFDGSTFTAKPTNSQFVVGSTFAKIENLAGASASLIMADTTDSGTIKNIGSSIAFLNSYSEGMRLTSTGLGIGTSSPGARLEAVRNNVPSGDNLVASFNNGVNTGLNIRVGGSTSGGYNVIGYGGGGGLRFVDDGGAVERLRLDASGNLGIGTNAPAYKLDVNGTARLGTTIFDPAGNVGIGVTPSAWGFGGNLELLSTSNISFQGVHGNILSNAYYDLSQSRFEYTTSGYAAHYQIGSGGQHRWFTAPSGTAGSAISFTQAMTLDTSGRLVVGATSTTAKFQVSGASANTHLLIDNAAAGENYFAANSANIFQTAGSERARITSTGNLLVGNTNGTSKITATGVIESTTGGFKFPDGTTQTTAVSNTAGAIGSYAMLRNDSGTIYAAGQTHTVTTISFIPSLLFANATGGVYGIGPTNGSVWQCMGNAPATGTAADKTTLWVRIS
jgi:hypothetical protein